MSAPRRCARCRVDISDYERGATVCAFCEADHA